MGIFKEFHRECKSPNHCGRKITKRKKESGKGMKKRRKEEREIGRERGRGERSTFLSPLPPLN